MDKIELVPYIFFTGNCREAMEFYKNIFGGELELMAYDDMPGDSPGKAEMTGKIMNASLTASEVVIRASDTQNASPETKKVELCLTGSNEPKLREIFESLAEGGNVKNPLKKEFWGDIFGQLTDQYGVDWMMNIAATKA